LPPVADPAGASSGALRIVYLVTRREFVTRARSRLYVIGTVLLMALLVGYIALQAVVFGRATTTVKAAFVGDAQALAEPLKSAAGSSSLKIEIQEVPDLSTGRDQVRDGTLDVLVSGDAGAPEVAVKDSLDPTVGATLEDLVRLAALNRALSSSGVDPSVIDARLASANFHLAVLDPSAGQRTQRLVVSVFVAALLYVALLLYGQLVATAVVQEKSNRIVEILLPTVRARHLIFGKVLGLGLLGLLQLLLLGAVGLVAVSRTHVISVPSVGTVAVAGGLLWFVLGFVFYALIFAAAGSLVSRQEDLPSVIMPVIMVIVGSYLVFFWVVANPSNVVGVVLSLLPPFAPVLMPARMAAGDAQAWQVVVAAALMVAGIVAVNALAARIYSNSVLRVGSSVKFLEAWRGSA
jgi:ABC-2 type transport system permease protein